MNMALDCYPHSLAEKVSCEFGAFPEHGYIDIIGTLFLAPTIYRKGVAGYFPVGVFVAFRVIGQAADQNRFVDRSFPLI